MIVLDNGAFHKAKKIIIPKNILLMFLPPYSPELNPAEQIWLGIKKKFVCKSFKSIKHLSNYLIKVVKEFKCIEKVQSICSYEYLMVM